MMAKIIIIIYHVIIVIHVYVCMHISEHHHFQNTLNSNERYEKKKQCMCICVHA